MNFQGEKRKRGKKNKKIKRGEKKQKRKERGKQTKKRKKGEMHFTAIWSERFFKPLFFRGEGF